MSREGERICISCRKSVKEFEKDTVLMQVVSILLFKPDLAIYENTVICYQCLRVAKKYLHFKLTWLNTEINILKRSSIFNGFLNICRFCLAPSKQNILLSLDEIIDVDMLQMLPEMDWNFVKNPKICTNCRENLEDYLKFITDFLTQNINCETTETVDDIFEPLKVFIKIEPPIFEETDEQKIKDESNIALEVVNTKNNTNLNVYEDTNDLQNDFKGIRVPRLKKFGCSRCNFQTNRWHTFNKHLLTHKSTYNCSSCDFQTNNRRNLTWHMLTHKRLVVETFKCHVCHVETASKYDLLKHMRTHKIAAQTIENSSYFKTQRNYDYMRQPALNIEKKELKCSMCDFVAKSKCNLQKHVSCHREMSEVGCFECPSCTFKSRHRDVIKGHMKLHKSVLERHTLVYRQSVDVVLYECTLCSLKTKYKQVFENHGSAHKEINEAMYRCEHCRYETYSESSLAEHSKVHLVAVETRMYQCSFCDFKSKYRASIKRHVLRHTGGQKDCASVL